MAVILSKKDEMRLRRAIQESPQNKRREELRARVESERRIAEEEQQKQTVAFRQWEEADRWLEALEDIRDAVSPKTADEEWNPVFCAVIEMIQDARRQARERWIEYACEKGGV